jgi:hypothetical protein
MRKKKPFKNKTVISRGVIMKCITAERRETKGRDLPPDSSRRHCGSNTLLYVILLIDAAAAAV